MSRLYVVATPIGNLGDLSPRAEKTLREAHLILAEDTRVTRRLLNAFRIKTPLESSHEHNETAKGEEIVMRMRGQDITLALVTDAGMPAVSDPGAAIVRAVSEAGFEVLTLPGPCAFASALSLSGFEEKEFTFFGFLPRKKGDLEKKLKSMAGRTGLAVIYESPHRLLTQLDAVCAIFPGVSISVSRELSKLYEQTIRGPAEDVRAQFRTDEGMLRGEFCLVLNLSKTEAEVQVADSAGTLENRLLSLLAEGKTLREASDILILQGARKNQVYAAALLLKRVAWTLLENEPGG
jgi:16S rRNA (cytidine1402-2'-O)-methyltransferase